MARDSVVGVGAVWRCASRPSRADDRVNVLTVGSEKEIKFSNMLRVAVGDPSVLRVESLGGGELRRTGRSVGKTAMLVFRDGTDPDLVVVEVRAERRPAAVHAGAPAPAAPADAGP